MRVCTGCLHTDERKMEHCPSCGGGSIARMTKHGALVSIPADAGMPCQRCFETGKDLRFRQYRRVVAFIFGASIATQAGYFCSSCRGKEFARWQGTTLITGWWGVFAALLYNPFAILMNLWALLAAPFDAGAKGAVDIDEIRAEAAEGQRLEDLYARMPTWLENLSEHELELVFADYDYSEALEHPDAAHPQLTFVDARDALTRV